MNRLCFGIFTYIFSVCVISVYCMNNFIHHKSGSNEYKDKQTNIPKLTLSSTINGNIMVTMYQNVSTH